MSEIKDGGAAFPLMRSINGSDGMTLRDYFAAQALAGICANQDNRVKKTQWSLLERPTGLLTPCSRQGGRNDPRRDHQTDARGRTLSGD